MQYGTLLDTEESDEKVGLVAKAMSSKRFKLTDRTRGPDYVLPNPLTSNANWNSEYSLTVGPTKNGLLLQRPKPNWKSVALWKTLRPGNLNFLKRAVNSWMQRTSSVQSNRRNHYPHSLRSARGRKTTSSLPSLWTWRTTTMSQESRIRQLLESPTPFPGAGEKLGDILVKESIVDIEGRNWKFTWKESTAPFGSKELCDNLRSTRIV